MGRLLFGRAGIGHGIRGYYSKRFKSQEHKTENIGICRFKRHSTIYTAFCKETITAQFITNQATFTPSAITVHSTENLVDNLFEAIPWRGGNVVSLVLFNLIHICKEVYLFRLVD